MAVTASRAASSEFRFKPSARQNFASPPASRIASGLGRYPALGVPTDDRPIFRARTAESLANVAAEFARAADQPRPRHY